MRASVLGLILLAGAAQAQERPAVRPTHDVAVEYRVAGSSVDGKPETQTVKMFWTGGGSLMRLESAQEQGFTVVDYGKDRLVLVMSSQHTFAEMPFDPNQAPGLDIPSSVGLTRLDQSTVANTQCTEWGMKSPQGDGRACITADGLVLRVQGPGDTPPALEAVSVSYGPQPAALFTVPPGYQSLDAQKR